MDIGFKIDKNNSIRVNYRKEKGGFDPAFRV
jgi:hypothetical protein